MLRLFGLASDVYLPSRTRLGINALNCAMDVPFRICAAVVWPSTSCQIGHARIRRRKREETVLVDDQPYNILSWCRYIPQYLYT